MTIKIFGQNLDTSACGIDTGLVKAYKAARYLVITMAVVGIGLYAANQHITWQEVKTAMLLAGANILIVWGKAWLTTCQDPIS